MKKFLNEFRVIIAQDVIMLALRILPDPERTELASGINPVAKVWLARVAAELKAKGIVV